MGAYCLQPFLRGEGRGLRASSYEPGNRVALLVGRIFSSVHMRNFSPVSELNFQPGYCSYGKFQLVYRDEQGATFQVSSR